MNFEQQRMFAGTLAENANAPMTLAALRDPETCFEGILTTALTEVGADRLVAYLQRGDAMWSYQALRCLPALEAYRPVLLKKVAESPNAAVHALRFIDDLDDHEPALRASAAELFNSVDTIDKFEFDNDGVYIAYFAMKWINNGTTYQVTREAGPSGGRDSPWPVGGGALFKGDYDKVGCADFSRVSGSPLALGDEIWVVAMAEAGDSAETPLRFTYQPNAGRRAKFVATGTVRSVGIDYGGSWPA